MRLKSRIMAILISVLTSCNASQQRRSDVWRDASPHRSEFVTVNGVKLDYLDWGGTGPTLVLIHGLTDSPHIFDDTAVLLRDRVRVIAYARRGHGQSDTPPGPYDQATLVEDLRQFLDNLGIKRTILLGWSMGGNEITDFAGRYPDRVDGLAYLEAGYDWSDSKFQSEFPSINPDASVLASFDAYRTWYRQTWFGDTPWTPGLEAYLRDTIRVGADGTIQRDGAAKTAPLEPTHRNVVFAPFAAHRKP